MKFMKLGSKPDSFETDGSNVRYAASELPTDIIVTVGEVNYYLHKFPLLSKSAQLQKLAASTKEENSDRINISDIPGGAAAFEICIKFCYGMTVTLNAYNVVGARCAAEYLEMHETVDKGNLIYKIEVFLSSSIFRSWKDSIIVLQTTKSLPRLSEELKVVSHCIDSIATKACVDVSKVDWSYSYNRKKLHDIKDNDPNSKGIRNHSVPKDWWVEDLCELEIDSYKCVLTKIKTKEVLPNEVIGESLKAYAYRRLSSVSKGMFKSQDLAMHRLTADTIVWLLPADKGCVSCSFLLKLLKAAIFVDSGDIAKTELVKRIGWQLEEASVNDILIRAPEGETEMYDVGLVQKMLDAFLMQDQNSEIESIESHELLETQKPSILSEATKLIVAKLIDGYLAEIARDPNLPVSKFMELAKMMSSIPRPVHDGLYRAIDRYLKEHPGISKSERKKICKVMDCKKLSVDACMHAVQNERLPLRVVMQVLFFEQVRAAASSGSSTPDLPKCIKDLYNGSPGSSRTPTTTGDQDWDAVATAEELEALKGEVASLRLANAAGGESKLSADKSANGRVKGMLVSKNIFTRLWSSKRRQGNKSGSDSSESLESVPRVEAKSTPHRSGRYSVS